jgi:uncharacterized protein YndB with AHSA1/START domain
MIDVVHQINSVARRLTTRTLEPGEGRVLTISQSYDADIEDMWDACTNAERIPRWFLPVTGDLRVGGRYQLEGNAGGTIERCDRPNCFAATWEFGGNVSWIEVRLVAEGPDRTRLELEQTLPVDDHWREFGPGAVGIGWELGLVGLRLHLDTGDTVDAAAVGAWMGSEEGRRFMTESSDRWYEADVAAGANGAEARAAADRTTAAYTGSDTNPPS